MMEIKQCERCKKEKEMYGKTGLCKSCYNYIHSDRQKRYANCKKWRDSHKEYFKKYYQEHNQYWKDYWIKNKEKIKLKSKKRSE